MGKKGRQKREKGEAKQNYSTGGLFIKWLLCNVEETANQKREEGGEGLKEPQINKVISGKEKGKEPQINKVIAAKRKGKNDKLVRW